MAAKKKSKKQKTGTPKLNKSSVTDQNDDELNPCDVRTTPDDKALDHQDVEQTNLTAILPVTINDISHPEENDGSRQLQDISQSHSIDDKLMQIVREVQIPDIIHPTSHQSTDNLIEAEFLRQQIALEQQQQRQLQHGQHRLQLVSVEQGQEEKQGEVKTVDREGEANTIDRINFIVLETENVPGKRSGEKRKLAESLQEYDDQVVKLKKLKGVEEKLDLDCEWSDCDSNFDSLRKFMEHVRIHIQDTHIRQLDTQEEFAFVCLWEDCGFECSQSGEMVRHINYHSYHTKLKCLGLNMIKSQGLKGCSLDTHQRNLFQDFTEPFKCKWSFCCEGDQEFFHPQQFYWHVASHVDYVNKLDCKWDDCTKRDFASKTRLKEHLRSHSQEKLIACPICGASFASKAKLFDHLKRQQETSCNFTCTNCNKSFALERLLRDHMRSHINTYECGECGMCWPTPSSLQTHIKYRHFKARDFPCDTCDYKAKSHHDLKQHARRHQGAVLSCMEGCGFVCKANSVMKNHFLKKHMKTPHKYACHLCEAVYGRGALLTSHLKKKHKITSTTSRFRYSRDESTGLYRVQLYRFEMKDEDNDDPSNLEIDTEVESLCQGSPTPSSVNYTASPTPSSIQLASPTPSSLHHASPTPSSLHHPSPIPASKIVAIRSRVSDSVWSKDESMGDSMRSVGDSVRSSAASVHSADSLNVYAFQDLGYNFPMGGRTLDEENQNLLHPISDDFRKSNLVEIDITNREFQS